MSVLKFVKLIFFADREHLFRFGRPIVGGCYVAMPHGPVSSELYDAIKTAPTAGRLLLERRGNGIVLTDAPSDDALSESDVEILDETDKTYGTLDAWRLRDMTHRLKAWRKNFRETQPSKSFCLPYEEFFLDAGRSDMLAVVREDREVQALFQ
jgi:uncharacterized phage-associated protein